ncbi:MAG: hypothetical protein ACJZ83_05315 [Pseudohongiellaceae bacterium]
MAGAKSKMQGPEIISSASRILSSASPNQLVIRIQPEVASELGLREGQTIRSAVAEDGKSIQLFRENGSRTFLLNLDSHKGKNFLLRVVSTPQGLTLRSGGPENQPAVDPSLPKFTQPTQTAEGSRWVRLLAQNPSLQQTPLLHSGLNLVKEFEKRGVQLDKEATKFFSSKATEISTASIKTALYFSGVIGHVFDKRVNVRSGSRDLSVLVQALKGVAAGSADEDNMFDDLDSAIDYLDSNKLKSVISSRGGRQHYQFILPLQDFPSVEVTITQLPENMPTEPSGLAHLPSINQPPLSETYEELKSPTPATPSSMLDEVGIKNSSTEAEQTSLQRETDYEQKQERAGEQSEAGGKGGWSIDLDWNLGEDDRVSINAMTSGQNGLRVIIWINNPDTLTLARAFRGRLLSQINSLDFNTTSCEFLEGERPTTDPNESLEKTSFTIDA